MDKSDLLKKIEKEITKVGDIEEILETIKQNELEFTPLPHNKQVRKIAAVDGGNGHKSLLSVAIIMIKACGAIFIENKKPEQITQSDIYISSISEDLDWYIKIIRDSLEFQTANLLLEKNPEVLILDGSLAGYVNRGIPRTVLFSLDAKKYDNEWTVAFHNYLLFLNKLLYNAQKNKTILIGVAKDSRTRHLAEEMEIPDRRITDYAIIQMKFGNQTGYTIPRSSKPEYPRDDNTVIDNYLKEKKLFQGNLKNFQFSYLKLRESGNPLKVDFPTWVNFDDVLSVLETYSDNKGYLLPGRMIHNWSTLKSETLDFGVNLIKNEILKKYPHLYNALFLQQRRDSL